MPFLETSHGICIRKNACFFTTVGAVRGSNTVTDNCKHYITYAIPTSQRMQLRNDFKNFSLTFLMHGKTQMI